jgi:hypothetical protein
VKQLTDEHLSLDGSHDHVNIISKQLAALVDTCSLLGLTYDKDISSVGREIAGVVSFDVVATIVKNRSLSSFKYD